MKTSRVVPLSGGAVDISWPSVHVVGTFRTECVAVTVVADSHPVARISHAKRSGGQVSGISLAATVFRRVVVLSGPQCTQKNRSQ